MQVEVRLKDNAEALLTRFRVMKTGEVVENEELAALISLDPADARFYAARHRAIKLFLRETGIRLLSVRGVGLRFPDGVSQVNYGRRAVEVGLRRIRDGADTVASVSDDRLPEQHDRDRRDHMVHRLNYLAGVLRAERPALKPAVSASEPTPRALPVG